ELLAKYKYPGEEHQVQTEDNYLLKMHRIARPGAKPVLLVHGLLDSSSTWVMMGPHSGLGYFLYDAGYDVWMGNVRGNRYSRGHAKLNPDTDRAYWSFSWHEIGMYDLPAMIDAVLAKTGFQKLSYFGHSQGTTTFFVMASSRPEYNAKLHLMSALAPVAFMGHMKVPLLPLGRSTLQVLGDHIELLPHSDLGLTQCMRSASTLQVCMHYMWELLGKDVAEFNKVDRRRTLPKLDLISNSNSFSRQTMVPMLFGLIPAGCNSKQPIHYIQLQASNRFAQYDYGKDNQRIYGRATPPDYPLEKITAPVALYYAQNDYLSSVEDVQRLAKRLPNVVENLMYPYKKWNHVDMIWGISCRRNAQPRLLQVMQKLEAGEQTQNAT
ncbi:hypothetical protein KR222_006079, partial [Zaprionus bogoriensis]